MKEVDDPVLAERNRLANEVAVLRKELADIAEKSAAPSEPAVPAKPLKESPKAPQTAV